MAPKFPSQLSLQIKKGIEAATSGRRSEALESVRELSKQGFPLSYRAQSKIFQLLSVCKTSSLDIQKDDLKRAVQCAKISVQLAPESIEFHWYLCYLLFLTAKDGNGRESFHEECKKALGICKPEISMEFQDCLGNEHRTVESVKEGIKDLVVKCDEERKQRMECYWSNLSSDAQNEFLTVSIGKLTDYFCSLKDSRVSDLVGRIISECISWAEANEKWDFWFCGCCNKKFAHPQLLHEHVLNKNSARLPLILEGYEPKQPETDWCSMITTGIWKPVDLDVAMSAIEEATRVDSSKFRLIPCEVWENFFNTSWPCCQDAQRVSYLERIQYLLYGILDLQCLTKYHTNFVIVYVMKKLRQYRAGLEPYKLGLHKTHLCVCFLGEPDLEELLALLEDLYHSAIEKILENEGAVDELPYPRTLSYTERVRILLDGHFLHIHLDQKSLKGFHVFEEFTEDKRPDVDRDSSTTYLDTSLLNYEPPTSKDFLNWILKESTLVKVLDSWTNDRKETISLSRKLYSMLQENVEIIAKTCREKCDILAQKNCIQNIRKMLLEETSNQGEMHKAQSREGGGSNYETVDTYKVVDIYEMVDTCETVLRKWRSSLISHRDLPMTETTMKVVSDVLEELEQMPMRNSSAAAAYKCATRALGTLEDKMDLEVIKLDAWIMRTKKRVSKLACNVDTFGKNNFQPILSVILHSYVKAQLESLVDEYANERDATNAVER